MLQGMEVGILDRRRSEHSLPTARARLNRIPVAAATLQALWILAVDSILKMVSPSLKASLNAFRDPAWSPKRLRLMVVKCTSA